MPDLLTFALPFFFVLAAVFGALEFSGVFKNKGVCIIISLVFAAVAVTQAEVLAIINQIMPYGVIIFIVVFFLAFFIPSFKSEKNEKDYTLVAVVSALVIILLIGLSQTDMYGPFGSLLQIDSSMLSMAALALIVIILFAAYKKKAG